MANWKETEVEGVVEEWRVYGKSADFKAIGEKYKIDQVVARVIRNRDIVTPQQYEEYINGDLSSLHSPWLLKDMDRAAQLVKSAIDNNETIRIVGDYDIDGINSIYILYSGLKRLGADVDYVVPHRVTDGYGINERLIDEAYDEGRQVIITCDNGIAAYNQIEYAKSLGMTVVVTDHHGVPFEEVQEGKREILPPADAVVDPARSDCTYPWKKICGAVVAMKLIQALFELYKRPEDEIYDFLEFAAVATVGDVVIFGTANWVILEKTSDGKVLMMKEKAGKKKRFSMEETESNDWYESKARRWLNTKQLKKYSDNELGLVVVQNYVKSADETAEPVQA